jgi:3'(2'), 5'-bisphosphate nucleotidase
MGPAITLKPLLFTGLRAVARAFPEILSVYNGSFTVQTKVDRSPITEADRRSNDIITAELSGNSPYPILSEEGGTIPYAQRRSWQHLWVVDPLDGTKEFVKRNGEFTINIALVKETVPILGIVYAPVLDLLYFAFQDGGAYKFMGFAELAAGIPEDLLQQATRLASKEPFPFDEQQKRERITVIASRSHRGPHFMGYVRKLKRRYAKQVEILRSGSALKPCLVADGSADIYPRFGPTMEWDTAAPHAIVREIGKRMVAMDTDAELVYNKEQLVNPSFIVY